MYASSPLYHLLLAGFLVLSILVVTFSWLRGVFDRRQPNLILKLLLPRLGLPHLLIQRVVHLVRGQEIVAGAVPTLETIPASFDLIEAGTEIVRSVRVVEVLGGAGVGEHILPARVRPPIRHNYQLLLHSLGSDFRQRTARLPRIFHFCRVSQRLQHSHIPPILKLAFISARKS